MPEGIEIYDDRLKELLRPDATLQKLTASRSSDRYSHY